MLRTLYPLMIAALICVGEVRAAEADSLDPMSRSLGATTSVIIRVPTAELATTAGAQRALARVKRTASALCGEDLPQWRFADVRRCREEAVATTIARANSPELSRVYAQSRPQAAVHLVETQPSVVGH